MNPKELVDYAASLDCIHCGLCLRTCPTYQLTGSEASSPRGRIYLMRGVAEGALDAREPAYREELEFCLVCRHCESVCPAGVRFGEMMEHARDSVGRHVPRSGRERFLRWLGFGVVLPSRAWLSLAHASLRVAQRTGLMRLAAACAGPRRDALLTLPEVPPAAERAPLPTTTPARGERRASVALLEGCVMPELFGRVNRASAEVLSSIGCEVRTAPEHVCCGALHAHNGELERARSLARRTIESFDRLRDERGEPLALVVNSAGCGAHLKEYGRLLADDPAWAARAKGFSRRVEDFSRYVERQAPPDWKLRLASTELGRVVWDDPCHLCHGQQIRGEPRALLDRVQGLERVEMEASESCCGSAGIYSLLRPDDSQAVFADKLRAFDASGAATVVTSNPGCQMQWQSGLARAGRDARVLHLAEVLERALPRSS